MKRKLKKILFLTTIVISISSLNTFAMENNNNDYLTQNLTIPLLHNHNIFKLQDLNLRNIDNNNDDEYDNMINNNNNNNINNQLSEEDKIKKFDDIIKNHAKYDNPRAYIVDPLKELIEEQLTTKDEKSLNRYEKKKLIDALEKRDAIKTEEISKNILKNILHIYINSQIKKFKDKNLNDLNTSGTICCFVELENNVIENFKIQATNYKNHKANILNKDKLENIKNVMNNFKFTHIEESPRYKYNDIYDLGLKFASFIQELLNEYLNK